MLFLHSHKIKLHAAKPIAKLLYPRHCEERSDEAIQLKQRASFARTIFYLGLPRPLPPTRYALRSASRGLAMTVLMNFVIGSAISVIISLFFVGTLFAAGKKLIAVTQITSHTALDAAREGVKDKIFSYAEDNEVDIVWVFENPQGNLATAVQIARKFESLKPDVIVAISTPSAQTVISATRSTNIPIVFCAVTDPIAGKLVKNLKKPGARVTGTYDFPPIGDQLDLMLELIPEAKNIGILFNPGEINSQRQLEVFRIEAAKRGLKVIEGAVLKSSEVLPATQKLLARVDVIYVPQDNTVVSALAGVILLATRNLGIPVIAPDPEGVKLGALATVGYSHYDEGNKCGDVVIRILQGENPGNIPVSLPDKKDVYLNLKTARALGIKIPKEILDRAKY